MHSEKESESQRSWWQFVDTPRVSNNRERAAAVSRPRFGVSERTCQATRCAILKGEWLMKAEQSLGTEEAVGEWSILMSSPADCILTAGDVMYGSQRDAPFFRSIIRWDSHQPPLQLQIHLYRWWQNNYLALTPRSSAAVDMLAFTPAFRNYDNKQPDYRRIWRGLVFVLYSSNYNIEQGWVHMKSSHNPLYVLLFEIANGLVSSKETIQSRHNGPSYAHNNGNY